MCSKCCLHFLSCLCILTKQEIEFFPRSDIVSYFLLLLLVYDWPSVRWHLKGICCGSLYPKYQEGSKSEILLIIYFAKYLWVSSAVHGSCCTPLYNCYWTGLSVKEQIPANNPNQQTNKQNLDVNNSCTADAQQRIWHL